MALPKEPRQLMINLMYLVLTAMLALNVSSEILNAFKTIDKSITNSNQSLKGKNEEMYMSMDAAAQKPETRLRVAPYNEKAKQVKEEAEKMVAYLENWKTKMIEGSGGRDAEGNIKAESDIDASTRLFIDQNGGNEIKGRITALREFMLEKIDPRNRDAVAKDLPLRIDPAPKSDANPTGDWARSNFNAMPVMGAITMLSKIQSDVRNSEAAIVNQLASESDAPVLKFDDIIGLGISKTSYALQGQKVEGNIMIAAYNRTVTPRISVSSGRVTQVKDGVGYWETVASGLGLQTVRGTVSLDMNGETKTRPFEFQYMVGSTGASMQLDSMNVVYAGLPNPISVSAAGYNMEDVSLSIPGANLAQTGKGKYVLNVGPETRMVTAAVNVRSNGATKTLASYPIRVKRIPNPEAQVGGMTQGGMSAAAFRVQLGVVAELRDFLFNIRAQVVRFKFTIAKKRGGDISNPLTVEGARFSGNPQVEALIKDAKPGDRIFIEDVQALLPDKTVRKINPITLTLN